MDFSVAQQKHQTNLMIPPGDFQPKQDALKIVKTDADFVCRSLVKRISNNKYILLRIKSEYKVQFREDHTAGTQMRSFVFVKLFFWVDVPAMS